MEYLKCIKYPMPCSHRSFHNSQIEFFSSKISYSTDKTEDAYTRLIHANNAKLQAFGTCLLH